MWSTQYINFSLIDLKGRTSRSFRLVSPPSSPNYSSGAQYYESRTHRNNVHTHHSISRPAGRDPPKNKIYGSATYAILALTKVQPSLKSVPVSGKGNKCMEYGLHDVRSICGTRSSLSTPYLCPLRRLHKVPSTNPDSDSAEGRRPFADHWPTSSSTLHIRICRLHLLGFCCLRTGPSPWPPFWLNFERIELHRRSF
jgi:hypothetical protein